MLIIGLTGGIGSGKSDAADIFAEFNVPIIDADVIAHELVEPDQPALQEIKTLFNDSALLHDGHLNREYVREQIFHSPELRKKLEAILHPRIRDEMISRVKNISAPYCILVIPLLVDIGSWELIDRILVIDVNEETQIQRVMLRDNQTCEQVMAILDVQISRQERLDVADDVLTNNKDHKHLRDQISELHRYYTALAAKEDAKGSDTMPTPAITTQNHMIYEQPLHERIRIFLKLEALFQRMEHHALRYSRWDAHALVNTLIEITQLTSRGNLKSDLIKEIDRQHAVLKRHRNTPTVDQHHLTSILDKQQDILRKLHSVNAQIAVHLKSDPLFSVLNQRFNIAGGASDFDIPAYYHWLHLPDATRQISIAQWLTPFKIVIQAISLCLTTIRDSTSSVKQVAEQGFYEHALSDPRAQLMRVVISKDILAFPEISAGKHRFSIRFFDNSDNNARPTQCNSDIHFTLSICGI